MKYVALILLGILAGCQTTPQTVVAPPPMPNLAPIDSKLLDDCKLPVRMPSQKLTQEEVEKYWSADRQKLIQCYRNHKGLVDVTKFRDEQLTGVK